MPPSNPPQAPRKSSSTSSSAAHLARVRDNQRRSRARRKEYLQDLEERFRKCQEKGVEASAEMQHAARRVLDENRRLRMALLAKGMTDDEVDRLAVDASASPPPTMDMPESAAVSELDSMLSKSRLSPTDLESSKRSSEESVMTEASIARGSVLMPRSTGDVFAGTDHPGAQHDSRQPFEQHISPVSVQGSSEHAAFGVPGASLSVGAAYTAPLSQESLQATSDWGLPPARALTDMSQYNQGYGSASSTQTWPASGQFGSSQDPLAGAENSTQMHVPGLQDARSRQLSGTAPHQQQALPGGGEMDMSELLSPELQAQFTAALEGQLSGELDPAADSRPAQWNIGRKW